MSLILLASGVIFVVGFLYGGNVLLGIAGIVCLMLGALGGT